VQPGDTLSGIAGSFDTTIELIMSANQLTAADVYTLRPGDTLIIPSADEPEAATPVSTDSATATLPAPTATPTTPTRTYTIQAGDTPIEIANRLGVSVDALLAANGLSNDDARRLRTGQVLNIPGSAQTTVIAPSTNNPVAAPSGQTAIRVDPPSLRSPENGAELSCGAANTLTWLPVNFLRASDQYLLHLGFVSGMGSDGSETITWVLEQIQESNNTLWSMDSSLCGLAPQEFGRKWYWYVEVIDPSGGGRVVASAPSQTWTFNWK